MSNNANTNMTNNGKRYCPIAPKPAPMVVDTQQTSIPPPSVFDFNTPIDRNSQGADMNMQPQDNGIDPLAFLDEPFINEPMVDIKTAEEILGWPIDLDVPLNTEYFTYPAVTNLFNPIESIDNLPDALDAAALVLDAGNGRCAHRTNGEQCDRFR